ncbi:MAG: metallopeptidase TldD-related protein [Anaerolineae bacterium]
MVTASLIGSVLTPATPTLAAVAFSSNLSLAFKIERGEIVGRVKDVSIAGNVYQDLQHVEAVSLESEWVYGGIRLPYILLPGLNVATRD